MGLTAEQVSPLSLQHHKHVTHTWFVIQQARLIYIQGCRDCVYIQYFGDIMEFSKVDFTQFRMENLINSKLSEVGSLNVIYTLKLRYVLKLLSH